MTTKKDTKEKTEIVKTEDIMETFDKLDEQQAIAELKGNFLDEYVYSYKDSNGKEVTGLSLVGVRETAREMNRRKLARIGISEREPIKKETEDYIELWTYAKDELNGGGYWGIKRQDKTIHYKSGGTGENKFTLEQALSKAQRNAIRGLIPEPFVKEMITEYMKQRKVRKVSEKDVEGSKIINKTGKGTGNYKKQKLDPMKFKVPFRKSKYVGMILTDCPKWWLEGQLKYVEDGKLIPSKYGYDNEEYKNMFRKAIEIKAKQKEEDNKVTDDFEEQESKLKV